MSCFVLSASDCGTMIINANDGSVGWHIANNRTHEPEVINLGKAITTKCFELYGKGVQIIDVGANIGSCTVPWGRHVFQWGYVTGYEAQETVFYALAGNVVLNNLMNTKVKNAAVTSYNGIMRIPQMNHNIQGNFGGLHLLEELNKMGGPCQPISYKDEHMVDVQTIALDDEGFERVDLLKIDVEGMEPQVLEGAQDLIKTYQPAVIAEYVHCGDTGITQWLGNSYETFQMNANLVCLPKSKGKLIEFVRSLPTDWQYRY